MRNVENTERINFHIFKNLNRSLDEKDDSFVLRAFFKYIDIKTQFQKEIFAIIRLHER